MVLGDQKLLKNLKKNSPYNAIFMALRLQSSSVTFFRLQFRLQFLLYKSLSASNDFEGFWRLLSGLQFRLVFSFNAEDVFYRHQKKFYD